MQISSWTLAFALVVQIRWTCSIPTIPQSPCPNLFYYYRDTHTAQILGSLQIPPPADSTRINIAVKFIVAVYLTSAYAGKISLADDKNSVVNRLSYGQRQPIGYSVHFPIQNPLPVLTELVVNNELLCKNNPEIGGTHTTLSLVHTLASDIPITFSTYPKSTTSEMPPMIDIRHDNRPEIEVEFHSPDILETGIPQPRPTTPGVTLTRVSPPKISGQDEECGRPVLRNNLVVQGKNVTKGLWPWLAAIFFTTASGQAFQCGGSLVSKRHVITAAHCVQQDPIQSKVVKPQRVTIYLGKHSLLNFAERNVQAKEVSKIIVHPQWGEGDNHHSFNDLAIIVLKSPADFNFNVQPVCLTDSFLSLENFGKVVGWGKDEQGNMVSKEPKQATMPIVSQEECLRSNRDFLYLTSNTTFCAGARDGGGPCNGDSGGGMYSQMVDQPGRWYLRGVVSLSLGDPKTFSCDLQNFVVFTDLSRFRNWIAQETGL
ncbi:chymotrypsin-C-like [Neocloeon triangulifer]|uniref:chymotrypsin-C-like n=1 Tax=Neocloeon triangulifer TaxID=2078957 RepID=UPI00286EBC22|nr:chymotrypsin-C-like [Neocloeon triangulifer]XP_059479410.1 chymotrypsin-C-like [Neocloeon triangulifer]